MYVMSFIKPSRKFNVLVCLQLFLHTILLHSNSYNRKFSPSDYLWSSLYNILSQAPHVEVLEHVSTILKEYGFCPTEEVMDTINLYYFLFCFTQQFSMWIHVNFADYFALFFHFFLEANLMTAKCQKQNHVAKVCWAQVILFTFNKNEP